MNVAIIGVGNISNCHIDGYRQIPGVNIVAFCDINRERLEFMGKAHGVTKLYTDVDEMLKEVPEIDAVSVCTWNCAHAKCSIAALNAGKHVLCEKPMAMNAKEAAEMKAAAEKSGKLLMIGFVRRHGNDCNIVREFVNKGYFGDIYYSKASYLRRNGCPGGWFANINKSGGGPLIDLGVHVIDLVRYIMNKPMPVSVYGATFNKLKDRPDVRTGVSYSASSVSDEDKFTVEDLATGLIRFDNGAVLSIEAAFSLNTKGDSGFIEIFGDKAGAKLNPSVELYACENGFMTNTTLSCKSDFDFQGAFRAEVRNFVDSIEGNAECIAPAEDGIVLMKILDALYESAKTGHEVIIK